MVRRFVTLGVPRACQAECFLDPGCLERVRCELECAAEDLGRAVERKTIPEIPTGCEVSPQAIRPHGFALGVAFPDPRGVIRTESLPPVVRQCLDVVGAQTLARVLRVQSQTVADRQPPV